MRWAWAVRARLADNISVGAFGAAACAGGIGLPGRRRCRAAGRIARRAAAAAALCCVAWSARAGKLGSAGRHVSARIGAAGCILRIGSAGKSISGRRRPAAAATSACAGAASARAAAGSARAAGVAAAAAAKNAADVSAWRATAAAAKNAAAGIAARSGRCGKVGIGCRCARPTLSAAGPQSPAAGPLSAAGPQSPTARPHILSYHSGGAGRAIAAIVVVRSIALADKASVRRCTVDDLRPGTIFTRRGGGQSRLIDPRRGDHLSHHVGQPWIGRRVGQFPIVVDQLIAEVDSPRISSPLGPRNRH